jgi:hypothetical protein
MKKRARAIWMAISSEYMGTNTATMAVAMASAGMAKDAHSDHVFAGDGG